jgi:hypothetical protein
VVNRQLKVQRLQANGISQRRLLRLCHLLNTRHQQKQNEEEKQQESSSSNNPVLLQKRQRGFDNDDFGNSKPFNLELKDIIEEAFERCGAELRTGYDLRTARRSMNLLFADWANRGINLWTVEEGQISLVQGTGNVQSSC